MSGGMKSDIATQKPVNVRHQTALPGSHNEKSVAATMPTPAVEAAAECRKSSRTSLATPGIHGE